MSSPSASNNPEEAPPQKDWRFWVVFLSCCFLALLVSLDGTVIVIALPRITNDLQIGDEYVWVANSFWLASTVFQPLCAQVSDIFGRKVPLLVSLAVFFAGGAVAGSASSGAALISGRTVQGLGGGGIMLLMEVVVCDIISLRERGRYLSIVLTTAAIGAIVGPPIGGAIANMNWRWIFYMNLPISAAIFVVMAFLAPLKHTRQPSAFHALSRIDWIGTTIFFLSTTSLLLGLLFGGILFPWDSWNVILPLVLGIAGFAIFAYFETSPYCTNPAIPSRLFTNRTSVAGYVMIFIQSALTTWVAFEWPLFFQGVREASPLDAGIDYIAFEAFLIPAAGISGQLVTKSGHYRLIQVCGFAILTLGLGLNVLLDMGDSTVKWVCLIAVDAIGLGSLLPTILPAVLAALPEKDVALGTGVYSFLRSFGYIWGVTVAAVAFNAGFDRFSRMIGDEGLRETLGRGQAYQYVSGDLIKFMPERVKSEVVGVYVRSLRVGWIVGAAVAAVGILFAGLSKHVDLRSEVDGEFGLQKKGTEVTKGQKATHDL